MNRTWIDAALIRAVKTMAQTAVAMIGTNMTGILDVDWVSVLSVSALAGVLSLLTSIAGLPECTNVEEMLEEEAYDYDASNDDYDEEAK